MTNTNEKIVLVAYSILVVISGAVFHFSYLASTLLFFIPPSAYVTVRRPDLFRPIGIYALAIGTPFVLMLDTAALYNHSWWETSMFPVRIFGLVPFETVLWAILYVYAMLVFYEYFFGRREETPVLSKRFWNLEVGLLAVLAIFLLTFSFHPEWFVVPYFYAVFVGVLYVAVSTSALIRTPKEFSKLWVQCLFFSALLFIGELGALAANQWGFSGSEYLGMIRIGTLTFPFEEMIWIITGVPPFIYIYLQLTDKAKLGSGLSIS